MVNIPSVMQLFNGNSHIRPSSRIRQHIQVPLPYFAHVLPLLVGEILELFVDSVVHCPEAASDEDEGDAADDDGKDVEGEAIGGVSASDECTCVHFERSIV